MGDGKNIAADREPFSKRSSSAKPKADRKFQPQEYCGYRSLRLPSRIEISDQRRDRPNWSVLKLTLKIGIFFLALTFSANGFGAEKIFTVGIVNGVSAHDSTVAGFKAGMTELGYVEGKNVDYIYEGVVGDTNSVLDAEIDRLVAKKVDLLVAVANEPAIRARKLLEGSGTPVLAVACVKMVESGLVKALKAPGGNLTGVQVPDSQYKALEWMTVVAPKARKILIPYNPSEAASTIHLPGLKRTADHLGITLVLREVRSYEEAVEMIESLPSDIGAIFLIPSQTLSPEYHSLTQAAVKRGLPLGSSVPLDNSVVMSFGSDLFEMGRQSARLADQILRGVKPADLPVEVADAFLNINITTAEKIGLDIPNSTLALAKKIFR